MPLRRENFRKIDSTIRLEGERANEQTNITRKRGHEGPEFPRMNEQKRRRRQRGRGKTAAVSTIVSDRQVVVGRTVADSVLQFVSIRPRKNPRKKARAVGGEGGGKRKQNARRRRRDVYIYIYIDLCRARSTKEEERESAERRAKHELFPATFVQKPRGILVFPTIHNALSIINFALEIAKRGETILFLEKNTLPSREAVFL